jgi:hypothetical protein
MLTEELPVFAASAIVLMLVLGLLLTVFRPFVGFLISVVVPISLNSHTMTFTRIAGPYFNLYDACALVGILALAASLIRERRRLIVPRIVLAMGGVLLTGFSLSTVQFGYTYETLRALRWAITLPLYCVMGANMVNTPTRCRSLLLTSFAGALFAKLQHLWVVTTGRLIGLGGSKLRVMGFGTAKSEAWLVAGPYAVRGKIAHPVIQIAAGALFLAATITHQTRTVAVAIVGALPLHYAWFRTKQASGGIVRTLVVGAILCGLTLFALGQLGLTDTMQNYADRITQTIETRGGDSSAEARKLAVRIEVEDWLESGLLVGNGLFYFQRYGSGVEGVYDEGGFGHVGYVTYLSQLGLVGFLVYAIIFPLMVLRNTRRIIKDSRLPEFIRYLGILTAAIFLYCAVAFAFTNHFLWTEILPGVCGGFSLTALRHATIMPRELANDGNCRP